MIKRDFIDKIRRTGLFLPYALPVSPLLPFLHRCFLFLFLHWGNVVFQPNIQCFVLSLCVSVWTYSRWERLKKI